MPPIGRSWNYTGRKKGGPTLGKSIGRDLLKDAKSFRSKISGHERRESDPDKQPESKPLDLIARGKEVTDEGIREIVAGLAEALKVEDGVSCRKLEELDLAENLLTSRSLKLLVPIVKLAGFDIRDIDLSGNHISIVTREDEENLESFLLAFGSCRALRKIDFSGNDMSNHVSFEIFLRVYCQHMPVDPNIFRTTSMSTVSDQRETDNQSRLSLDLANMSMADTRAGAGHDSFSPSASLSDATILKRRRGLRSIPYIVFNGVGMTDTGALYLSYVLESHFFPQYLQRNGRSNAIELITEEKYHSAYPFGISYESNDAVSTNAARILELAKAVRADAFGDADNVSLGTRENYNVVDVKHLQGQRRNSGASGQERLRRRESGVSSDSSLRQSWDELDSLRKKVQRATIEDFGVRSVQIWATALRMLVFARTVLPSCKPPQLLPKKEHIMSSPLKHMRLPSLAETAEHHGSLHNGMTSLSHMYTTDPWGRPQQSFQSMGKGKTASRQKIVTFISKIKGGKHLDAYHSYERELPVFIWKRIFAYASDAHGVLSDGQQDAVISFARDRVNLKSENQLLYKQKSVQIWSVLELVGCLTYDMRA